MKIMVIYRIIYDAMRLDAKLLITKVDELVEAYMARVSWNLCDDDPDGHIAM